MKLATTITLVLIYSINFAQLTPSERKRIEAEKNGKTEENLNKRQLKELAKIKQITEEIWTDQSFNITDHPEKWNNESAIILNQKRTFSYLNGKKLNSVDANQIVRKRIKLLDNAALEEYSTFYFKSLSSTIVAGFKVIKPDASEIIIDIDAEAVDIISNNALSYYPYPSKKRKVAIPNLEVGDIIDFFYSYSSTKDIPNEGLTLVFEPFHFSLIEDHPVAKQECRIVTDKGFYINLNTYNGAPKFEKTNVNDAGVSVSQNIYSLIIGNKEKINNTYFNYNLRTTPTIKFQVYFTRNKNKSKEFLGDAGIRKSEKPTNQEIQNIVIDKLNSIIPSYAKSTVSYVMKKHRTSTNEEKIKAAYYHLNNVLSNHNISNIFFVANMRSVLKDLKIPFELACGISRKTGTLDDLLYSSEIEYLLKVTSDNGQPFFLQNFTYFSDYNLKNPNLISTEVIVFPNKSDKKIDQCKKEILPMDISVNNLDLVVKEISISDKLDIISIVENSTSTGLFKIMNSVNLLINSSSSNLDQNLTHYNKWGKRIISEEQLDEKKKKERLEKIEENLKNQFDLKELKSFTVVETGKNQPDQPLITKMEYDLNGIITKAGRNYFLAAGSLIGNQLKLDAEDKTGRTTDAYIDFAKTYSNEITINIPAGYTVENLEEMNINVDNEAASFVSTVTFENSVLKITTSKVYKKTFVENKDWSKMVEMLDAAVNLEGKKLILKKI
jgi:hypothetical protein